MAFIFPVGTRSLRFHRSALADTSGLRAGASIGQGLVMGSQLSSPQISALGLPWGRPKSRAGSAHMADTSAISLVPVEPGEPYRSHGEVVQASLGW